MIDSLAPSQEICFVPMQAFPKSHLDPYDLILCSVTTDKTNPNYSIITPCSENDKNHYGKERILKTDLQIFKIPETKP